MAINYIPRNQFMEKNSAKYLSLEIPHKKKTKYVTYFEFYLSVPELNYKLWS